MGGEKGGGGPSKDQLRMQQEQIQQGWENIALQQEQLVVAQKNNALSAEQTARQREQDAAKEQQQMAMSDLRSRGAFLGMSDTLGVPTEDEETLKLAKKAQLGV